ncbi:fumarylacetoacetate hydrolase family protein [Rhodococcus sp. (in: high G+C Gram-positive bacteria)]|uniref:fumarylacetoacetate hydrolase family protein n=1 Tax=Rhodococcus sp. TaxID=1831 RepID=UPI00388FDF2A
MRRGTRGGGRSAAHRLLNPSDALSAVAGYTTSNDMGDYDWVLHRGGQWVKGKAFPDFNPIGRWLWVGRERHPPPESLLTTRVNGAVVQMAQLSDMRHTPPYLVWYVSQFLCLMPGDAINCGTPGGTALAAQNYLQVGDVVEVDISNVGTHCSHCLIRKKESDIRTFNSAASSADGRPVRRGDRRPAMYSY